MSELRYSRTITSIAASLLLGFTSVSAAQTVLINTDSSMNSGNPVAKGADIGSQPPLPIQNSQPRQYESSGDSGQVASGARSDSESNATEQVSRVWQTEDGPVVERASETRAAEQPTQNSLGDPPLPVSNVTTASNAPPLPMSDGEGVASVEKPFQQEQDDKITTIDVRGQNQDDTDDSGESNPQPLAKVPDTEANSEDDWSKHAERKPITTAFTPIHKETWRLTPGSLREQLLKWGKESDDWEVLWFGEGDYTVQVTHEIKAELDEAVIEVIGAYVARGAAMNIIRSRVNNTIAIRSSQ